ncbi:DEAD/DEAH box helicase [Halosimplex salinum]|uniref:DEAD/DEAH box helicase n=1 Tax=Halosimplex salinum TaxID=1710538 RepID=UPI000F4AB683|nr:DEAD/DEAH box helicase [Halosimplex salinum]
MRYVDRYTNFDDLAVKPEVAAILRASVYNQQLFNEPDGNPTYTTESIKYAERNKPRADYRDISEISGDYDVDYEAILELLDYGETALEFQLESWSKLARMDSRAHETGRDQGLVISAPTGFGKTACFFGFVMKQLLDSLDNPGVGASAETDGDAAIFVYPSRALLHDQLTKVMELFYRIKSAGGSIPNFGFWYGNQPQTAQEARNTSRSTAVRHRGGIRFTGAKYWDEAVNDRALYISDDDINSYVIENHAGDELFDSSEFYIGRQEIVNRGPNLLLTTLESLENISMKPHYDIANLADYFVFDEIHQYSGLRGSHAANIVKNIKRVRHSEGSEATAPALFIGSSATIQDPGRFGRSLFGLSPESEVPSQESFQHTSGDFQVVSPSTSDIEEDSNDKQHYYFMLSTEDDEGPDVSSQFLQHGMMVGHSLLREAGEDGSAGDRSNILTFIDSKSLLRNLDTKFSNADRDDHLYEYHFGHEGPGEWSRLASETDHIAQDDEPLREPLPVYSGSDHSIDEIPDHDIILGTKFLEVGVDIDTLQYIINYREPESVAALKQRAGRAAREDGDAHMFNLLSSYSGDTNFYYRADGFVNKDISTPIRTNNHVVDEIHDWFYQYYQDLASVDDWTDNESEVLENFFDSMGWSEYNEFIQSPQVCFDQLLDIDVYSDSLLDDSLARAFGPLEDKVDELNEYSNQFQSVVERDAGEVFLQEDAVEDLLQDFRRILLEKIDTFINVAEYEGDEQLIEELQEVKQTVREITFDDPDVAANQLEDEINGALGLVGRVRQLDQSMLTAENPTSEFFDLSDTIQDIVEGVVDGKIQESNRKRRISYYLRKALEEIREYKSVNYRWGSLYAVKYLLRGAYYYEKALRIDRLSVERDEDAVMGDIWYVPPNYFADAGWYFDLIRQDDESKKSVDKLLTQYLPFRTEYASGRSERGDPTAMNVFQPDVIRTEDGDLEFNFSELGEIHNGVLVPDRVELKRVYDESEHRGDKIVPYNSNTFEILDSEEVERLDQEIVECGQVYASPQIATRVNDPTENLANLDKSSQLLELRSMNAQAWIQAVDLEITQSEETGGWTHADYDAPTLEQTIFAGDQRLGYSLNTRGLTLDIESLIDRFRTEDGRLDLSLNHIPQHKNLSEVDPEDIVTYTTAHLLTMLVADVAGVNTQVLLYGINQPADETGSDSFTVHTFEQIEGGQGVTDLFWEILESRPEEVLDSLYRLTRNAQVLNEKLWAAGLETRDEQPAWERLIQDLEISRLRSDDDGIRQEERAATGDIISEYLGYTYEQTLERITDELVVTLNHIEQLASRYEVAPSTMAELKADIALARMQNEEQNNGEEIPERIITEYDIFDEIDQGAIRPVLMSPDFDGCEANLHLDRTLFDRPQSEVLSDGLLPEIEEWLVDKVPAENEIEEMDNRGKLSAYSDDEHAYFLRF